MAARTSRFFRNVALAPRINMVFFFFAAMLLSMLFEPQIAHLATAVGLSGLVAGHAGHVGDFSLLSLGGMFLGEVSNDIKGQIVAGPLQNVSIAYKNGIYIGERVAPIIERVGPKALITVYPKGAWFRDEAGIRAPSTEAKRGSIPLDSISVTPDEYAYAKEVTDEDRRNAKKAGAPPVTPDQDAVLFATDKVDLSKERRIKAVIAAASWADGNGAGGEDAQGLWAAGGSNTFLADIRKAQRKGRTLGIIYNRLLLDAGTFLSLQEEATVLSKIQYTQRGVLTTEILASLLQLEEVVIGEALYSTAKENKAATDFTSAAIWEINAGKGMGFLYFAPKTPGLKTPSALYQARDSYDEAGGQARRITTWRENSKHQDVYEVAEMTDIVVCAKSGTACDAGYLFKDTLSD